MNYFVIECFIFLYFRLLPNNYIKNEQIPSHDQHIEEATDDKQQTEDCKRTVEATVEKPLCPNSLYATEQH